MIDIQHITFLCKAKKMWLWEGGGKGRHEGKGGGEAGGGMGEVKEVKPKRRIVCDEWHHGTIEKKTPQKFFFFITSLMHGKIENDEEMEEIVWFLLFRE